MCVVQLTTALKINNFFFLYLEDLSEHFSQFGEIENINVKVDAATGRARGFAFIVYKTMEGLDNVSVILLYIEYVCFYYLINLTKIIFMKFWVKFNFYIINNYK